MSARSSAAPKSATLQARDGDEGHDGWSFLDEDAPHAEQAGHKDFRSLFDGASSSQVGHGGRPQPASGSRSSAGISSRHVTAALEAAPATESLKKHAVDALGLASSLGLPSSKALAAQVAQAEQRSRLATERQNAAKNALLKLIAPVAEQDAALSTELSALPERIDSTDEAISTSAASVQLEARLESNLEALVKLRRARDYFALLAAAEDLRTQALATDPKDVRAALPALSKLAGLCEQSQSVLTDERIRALVFIRAQRDHTFHQLRKRAISNLRSACQDAGWSPMASAAATIASSEGAAAEAKTQVRPLSTRLDAHKGVQSAWKDICRFQRTAERLGLMPPATAPLLRTEAALAASGSNEQSQGTSLAVTTGSGPATAPRPGSTEYVPLLAVTVLLDVLLLRFRYHFDSSRPSNRLDKPEWYLNHILGLVRAYGIDSDLFRPGTGSVARLCALGGWGQAHGVVPVSKKAGRSGGEQVQDSLSLLDTGAELLHGLLVPLRSKLVASMPLLLPHPALLAHTISEYIDFDDALRSLYPAASLQPPDTSNRGPALSLADTVLNNSDWFAAWLEGERAHAEERLDEILNAPDAWSIQSADGVEDEEDAILSGGGVGDDERGAGGPVQRFPTQPTSNGAATTDGAPGQTHSDSRSAAAYKTVRAARQIIELLESVQERARPLPLLTHRVAFFARIQLPLLRAFADRLARSLDAFEGLSAAFARSMPGAIGEGVNLAVAGAGGGTVAQVSTAAGVVLSTASSVAGRHHHSANGDMDMVRGLRGLGRLLKAHLSAAHIVETLSGWQETAYFLALASELRETEEGKKLAVDLRIADTEAEQDELDKASLVSLLKRSLRRQKDAGQSRDSRGSSRTRDRSASRTRGGSRGDDDSHGREADSGEDGVWDEVLGKYKSLLCRATAAMERLVVHEIVDALKPYSYRRWDEGSLEQAPATDDDEDDDEGSDKGSIGSTSKKTTSATVIVEPIPTPSLLPALTLLSTHLGHLLPALPPKYALPVYRSIASTLSTSVVDRVVMSGGAHRFTLAGGQRFARDVESGWFGVLADLMDNFGRRRGGGGAGASRSAAAVREAAMEALGRRPRAAWRELEGAARLLSLPPTLPPTAASTKQGERDGNGDGDGSETTKWTLDSVTRALYEMNELDERLGWVAVRRELQLGVPGGGDGAAAGGGAAGLSYLRAREVIRRRIECAR